MTPASPRLRRVVLAFAGAVLLSACDQGPFRSPAAVVGEARITHDELGQDIRLYEFLSGLTQQRCGTPVRREEPDAACARFVLSNLILERLALDYARDRGLGVTDDEVIQAIGPLEQSAGGAARFRDRLAREGLTVGSLRDLAEGLLLVGKVREDLAAQTVPESELRALYEERILEFTQIHAAHILVGTEAEAEQIAARATIDNFASLARSFSIDPGSAQQGGDLGLVPAAQFVPEFARAAAALEAGEISDPVQTQFGWHVIRLIEKQVVPFEEARSQLVAASAEGTFTEWLRERLQDVEIRVNPRYGRLDRQTGEVLPITSTISGEGGG